MKLVIKILVLPIVILLCILSLCSEVIIKIYSWLGGIALLITGICLLLSAICGQWQNFWIFGLFLSAVLINTLVLGFVLSQIEIAKEALVNYTKR